MKRLWLLVVACLVMSVGCIEFISPSAQEQPKPNTPPVAYIDSISTNRIFQEEVVTFQGHGLDPDGDSIAGYRWRSSLDGIISTQAEFETDTLSSGKNTVYFSVQDSQGEWSKEIYRDITVIPPGSMVPILHEFYARPTTIVEGESSTLFWDISGADTVTITPDIGNVAHEGTRIVYPSPNNVYRLEAINDAGKTEGTVRITVVQDEKVVELYAIPEESGSADYCSKTSKAPIVGSTSFCLSSQAFLSFDIQSIPQDAKITSVSLDITHYITHGDPFILQGSMGIFNHQYGTLDKNDFVDSKQFNNWDKTGAIILLSSLPHSSLTSDLLANSVQRQVDDGRDRFQIRIQFEKMRLYEEWSFKKDTIHGTTTFREDNLEFVPEKIHLVVKYNKL